MASERRHRARRPAFQWAAALAVAGLALVPAALAEELENGEWSGKIRSKGRSEKVTYDVDFPDVTMTWGGKDYPFEDVRLADGKLEFRLDFNQTDRNPCVLVREEAGSYEGRCGEEKAKRFSLLMIPPRTSESGDDETGRQPLDSLDPANQLLERRARKITVSARHPQGRTSPVRR